MSEGRCCCNCRHNIRTGKPGYIKCHCEITGEYLNYVRVFEGWCRKWASDEKYREEKRKGGLSVDDYGDRCYECKGYGDEMRYDPETDEYVYNCDDCPYNGRDLED